MSGSFYWYCTSCGARFRDDRSKPFQTWCGICRESRTVTRKCPPVWQHQTGKHTTERGNTA